ncbi:MAG TPA: apolipoprotein N-acyltransferase [Caulobacteraceae bacterium]|nr:apolipoprotein N-acyltransferase [Caulobacteraceae bacterium]
MTPRAKAWAARGAAVVAGLVAAFAHPPFGILPGLLGYAAILWLLDDAGPERPLRSAFFRAWLAGSAYFTVSTWWIAEAFFVDAADQGWMAPFAVTAMATGLALFWGLGGVVYRLAAPTGALRLLVFAGAFTAAEWLRGNVLTGFPWDLPGETWRAGSAPSQTASLVGAYGLTWITLAICAAPGLGWRRRDARIALGAAVAGLVGLYGFGAWRLAGASAAPAPGAPMIRIVQPDTPEQASYDSTSLQRILGKNLALTAAPSPQPPDIVIWSEAGLPAAEGDYLAPGTWTNAAIQQALHPGETLITGGFRDEPAPPGAYAPDGILYHNSLVSVRRTDAGLVMTGLYDKHTLVPFGEYLPAAQILAPLGVQALIHVGPGFTPGPTPRPIAPQGVPPFQALICYESLFPGVTRHGAALAGFRPAWIVNISDDAWFGVTSGPWQHLNLASYRAIEEGLPVIRATPTGISAVIDAYGRIVPSKLLGPGVYGAIDSRLPPALSPTIFERYGETGTGLLIFISIAAVFQKRHKRTNATLRRNGKDG